MGFDSYFLVKAAAWVLSPLPLTLFFVACGLLAWGCRWRRTGASLVVGALLALWAFSTPRMAWELADHLERRYPVWRAQDTPAADVAVVLGGALAAARLPLNPQVNLGSAADRVFHAAALYRAGKVKALLLSGGTQPGIMDMPAEAELMRALLREEGVPDRVMWLETRSRNTRENARYSMSLLRERGVRRALVVTSAAHMPRAMVWFTAAAQAAGVQVTAAATDAEALGDEPDGVAQFLPEASALDWSSRSVKEYLGWAQARWMTGMARNGKV